MKKRTLAFATSAALTLSAALVGSVLTTAAAWADCQSDVTSIRGELEEKGKALQAAIKGKKDPQTLCSMFKAYTTSEAKWVKFLNDNKDWCQIPAQAIEQAATGSKKTIEVRNRICNAAANGVAPGGGSPKPPPQTSMSSALGITTGYSVNAEKNTGVFGTLSGNALK